MNARAGQLDRRGLVDLVVRASLDAAEPGRAVAQAWPCELRAGAGRIVLISVGKGSVAMAGAAAGLLGERLARGVVVGPREVVARWSGTDAVEVFGADHPIATESNVEAARRVEAVAASCARDETLLTLISGGASAYLTLPSDGLGLADIAGVTGELLRAGATIEELNCVRKHCETLKGGGLARAGGGAGAHWSLVLSDVLGDPLDAIGSGPTAGDPSTFAVALGVLDRFTAVGAHAAVRRHLERGRSGEVPETIKPGDPIVERVHHVIIANNAAAVDGVAGALRARGVSVVEVRYGVRGEASEVGRALGDRVRELDRENTPACVVWGGETTVTVGGADGLGGRNQELALAAAERIGGLVGGAVVTLATDGVDGPTDAAGGCVDGGSWELVRERGIDPREALRRHDSHRALDCVGALIRIGATGTNVNDVAVGVAGLPERTGG